MNISGVNGRIHIVPGEFQYVKDRHGRLRAESAKNVSRATFCGAPLPEDWRKRQCAMVYDDPAACSTCVTERAKRRQPFDTFAVVRL